MREVIVNYIVISVIVFLFYVMLLQPPRFTHCISAAASDVEKRQVSVRHLAIASVASIRSPQSAHPDRTIGLPPHGQRTAPTKNRQPMTNCVVKTRTDARWVLKWDHHASRPQGHEVPRQPSTRRKHPLTHLPLLSLHLKPPPRLTSSTSSSPRKRLRPKCLSSTTSKSRVRFTSA